MALEGRRVVNVYGLDDDECLDGGREDDPCRGPVERHPSPGSRSMATWPRCEHHWARRLDRYEEAERWADSDVPPPWFDPTIAGERWDDDY